MEKISSIEELVALKNRIRSVNKDVVLEADGFWSNTLKRRAKEICERNNKL